jgi:hypothetical protein
MEKMIESAASSYLPKVEEKAKARREELEQIKSKIRTDPEQVEAWFDQQIQMLSNIDVKQIMKDATAGI